MRKRYVFLLITLSTAYTLFANCYAQSISSHMSRENNMPYHKAMLPVSVLGGAIYESLNNVWGIFGGSKVDIYEC